MLKALATTIEQVQHIGYLNFYKLMNLCVLATRLSHPLALIGGVLLTLYLHVIGQPM